MIFWLLFNGNGPISCRKIKCGVILTSWQLRKNIIWWHYWLRVKYCDFIQLLEIYAYPMHFVLNKIRHFWHIREYILVLIQYFSYICLLFCVQFGIYDHIFDCLFLFLPRDAMHKRGLCCHAVSVCLSVCPTVRHVRGSRQNE